MTDYAKTSGIYAIRAPSGRMYVGSSSEVGRRWTWHRNALRRGAHHNEALQAAYVKYGEALEYFILEHCDISELIEREQAYVDGLSRSLYNFARTVETPHRGRKFSDEHRQKIAAAARGRRHNAKTRRKISEVQKGKTLSAECREKMSRVRKGRKRPEIPTGESGIRGVYRVGRKWLARVDHDGRRVRLGQYATIEEAATARTQYLTQVAP